MPGPSIESVNSTSTSNVPGDWSQEGDFVNGIKITAFVFLALSSMVDNALLIAVFNMAFANVLLTVYAFPVSSVNPGTAYSHQWLITGELLCLFITVYWSNGSLSVHCMEVCL